MKKINIGIIFGGCSSEYEVSLKSAYAVIKNFNKEIYNLVVIGITRERHWFHYKGDIEDIRENTWFDQKDCVPAILSPDKGHQGLLVFTEDGIKEVKLDVVFPVLHGKNGEDGSIQGLLELAGIPFVGCGILSSSICMDKDIAHKLVSSAGVTVPKSVVIEPLMNEEDIFNSIAGLQYPLFIKPVQAGSSFGISKIAEKEDLIEAIDFAYEHDNRVKIEEEIKGFEVGCAILGNQELIMGQVDEIELKDGFFDYNEKYTLETSEIHMPARIEGNLANRIKETAATIYKALQCTGVARVDMFLTPENQIVFNEVNTIPGFTDQSRYPMMLKGMGYTFSEILDLLVKTAITDEKNQVI